MCGIAGVIDLDGKNIQQSSLQTLSALLSHRGPDDVGHFVADNIGLIHTRLSIQDLSAAGHQPMRDEKTKSCLVFNGEIYNFKSLRADLQRDGVQFSSSGDSEVLLKCCLHYGVEKTLNKLNGMFSFAFWHGKTKELWLVRDRMYVQYPALHGDSRATEESKGVGPSVSRRKGNSRKVEREDDEDSWNGAS